MKNLVTGGAGFLGYHLACALAARGDVVDLVDDLSRGRIDDDLETLLALPNVRLIRADLTQSAFSQEWGDDYDAVYHLAGIVGVRNVTNRPDRVLSVNARSLLNVLDWFERSRSRRLLFASTSEVYAWTMSFHALPIPTPEDVPLAIDRIENDRAAYALSKILGEMAVLQTCRRADRRHVVVRYHNVYGPRMGMDHAIPEIVSRVLGGRRPVEVYSPGERRAFCYVSDAIDATLRLMEADAASGIYNVGNDREEISVRELAKLICELAGEAGTEVLERPRAGAGIARRCPDLRRLVAATGYEPRMPLREGLELTMRWYRSRLKASGQRISGTDVQVR